MDHQAHHFDNHQKKLQCFEQLQSMGMVPKSKMWQFYRNVSKAWAELDKEFVECRRVCRMSSKYYTLEQNYYECITVFEQYSLMAALTY